MGFLDQNTTYLGNITFPVVEGYCGSIGAAMATVDGQMNDMALFEAALKSDFTEALALKEDADIMSLQEASVSGIVDRIIEFLKKLGAKIQSIFTNIMAKIESYMNKDSKAFVEKYSKNLAGKSFKGMKAKYAAPSGDGYIFNRNYTFDISVSTGDAGNFEREEFIAAALGDAVGESKCTAKEFKEAVHKKLYGEESVKENWELSDFQKIGARLKASDKPLKELKARNDSLQSSIKKVIADISKSKKAMGGKVSLDGTSDVSGINTSFGVSKGEDGKYSNSGSGNGAHKNASSETVSKLQANLGRAQQEAAAHQTAIMTFCSTIFNEAKWGIAQDRRVFAQAVAYHSLKEGASLAEAAGEVAQYECESAFEDMEVYA